MKSLSRAQEGFGHLVLILAVLVIAIVGVVSYRVLNVSTPDVASEPTTSSTATKTESADIKSTADVKKASKALDDTAIDGAVNPNSIDSDLNSLL